MLRRRRLMRLCRFAGKLRGATYSCHVPHPSATGSSPACRGRSLGRRGGPVFSCWSSSMSDASLGSQDSQAAWTALGNRMRRNRRWLLLALVALGIYMGAETWTLLGVDRPPVGDDWLTRASSSTDPAPLDPSPA